MKALLRLLVAGALVAGTFHGGAAASDADRDRYIELSRRKERAERLNALWKLEAELSAKRTTYAVLDLSERKLYFKVRGRTFKAIPFTSLETTRQARPVDPEELAFRSFTLQLKEGKGVETETIQRKTLTEAEKRAAGSDASEDEPLGAEQGGVESGEGEGAADAQAGQGAQGGGQKMQGVAGGEIPPDPPSKYHMGFDGDLSIMVVADVPRTPQAVGYESFLALAREVGRRFVETPQEAEETLITVRLPLPLAQQIYRQLLPGQRLLITL